MNRTNRNKGVVKTMKTLGKVKWFHTNKLIRLMAYIAAIVFLFPACGRDTTLKSDTGAAEHHQAYKLSEVSPPLSFTMMSFANIYTRNDILYCYNSVDKNIIMLELQQPKRKKGEIKVGPSISLSVDDDGNIWSLQYAEINTSDSDYAPSDIDANYNLVVANTKGEILNKINLDFLQEKTGFYPSQIIVDNNKLYVLCRNSCVAVLSISGADISGAIEYTLLSNYITQLIHTAEEGVFAGCVDYDGFSVRQIDSSSQSWGNTIKLEATYRDIICGLNNTLLLDDGMGVYRLNPSNGEITPVLNWLYNGLYVARIVTEISEDTFLINYQDTNNYANRPSPSLGVMERVQMAGSEPITLRLATMDRQPLVQMVLAFNRNNRDCKIDLIDYSIYNTLGDSDIGIMKMVTEIFSSNPPDIVDLITISAQQYIAQGLLEDLYPLIDADRDIKRTDFISSLLEASEYEGKLYQLIPGFSIETVIGSANVVGKECGWTFEEFKNFVKSNPGKSSFGRRMTRYQFLTHILNYAISDFVDWQTGKCYFDSQDFIDVLELATTFPRESELYTYAEYDAIASGNQLLFFFELNEILSVDFYHALFNGDITFIGFPSAEHRSNAFRPYINLGITSISQHKDTGWRFLRSFLVPGYQNEFQRRYSVFPALSSALETKYSEHRLFSKDFNGNVLLGGYGIDWIELQTQNDPTYNIAKINELIYSTSKLVQTDSVLIGIVLDEIDAFFYGDKPAEEVAKIIQNRAQTYVWEQTA